MNIFVHFPRSYSESDGLHAAWAPTYSPIPQMTTPMSLAKKTRKGKRVQWVSEYQPVEHSKHLNTKVFEIRISNGSVFKW